MAQDAKTRLTPRRMGPAPPIGRPGAPCGLWRPFQQRSRTSPKSRFQTPCIAGWDYRSILWDTRDTSMLEWDTRDSSMLLRDAQHSNATARALLPHHARAPATPLTLQTHRNHPPRPPSTFPRQNPGNPHARVGHQAIPPPRQRGCSTPPMPRPHRRHRPHLLHLSRSHQHFSTANPNVTSGLDRSQPPVGGPHVHQEAPVADHGNGFSVPLARPGLLVLLAPPRTFPRQIPGHQHARTEPRTLRVTGIPH